jgi:hypothetical protein
MNKYISVLEEWDDVVSEGWSDSVESNFLNPQEYISGDILENCNI